MYVRASRSLRVWLGDCIYLTIVLAQAIETVCVSKTGCSAFCSPTYNKILPTPHQTQITL